MNTLTIAVAALGSGLREGAGAVLGMDLPEGLAALGAFVVAALGVLVVRVLNSRTEETRVALAPRPENGGLKRAA